MTRDEVLAALPGYVLDALEPDEKRAIEEYLGKHPELSTRVRDLDAASAALADSAPIQTLPAQLKQSVMERVRAEVQSDRPRLASRIKRTQAPAPPAPTAPGKPAPARSTSTSPARQSALSLLRRWWVERRYANYALGLAAALALLLAVVVIQAQLIVQRNTATLNEVQTQIAALENENATLRAENQALQTVLAEQRHKWATVLDAQEGVLLAGTEDAPAAEALFYAADGRVLVVVAGLSELTSEQTYQLWLIPADGAPVSAGLLDAPRAGAAASYLVDSPLERAAYTAVGVSVEPAGGSAAPTGPIVLLGEVG